MDKQLNKVFDATNRKDRRKILDCFDLSKDDKNKVLNKLENNVDDGGAGDESVVLASFEVQVEDAQIMFNFEEGMTWNEFFRSKYCIHVNTDNNNIYIITRDSANLYLPKLILDGQTIGNIYEDTDGTEIDTEDNIINNHVYSIDS